MLRSVCFKNFVHFKEKQFLDFQGAGPFIFIGENGAGKSSVLEGIRRCLHTELSTSVSSSFENDKLSYFICIFETEPMKKENDAGSLKKENDADPLKKKGTDPLKKEYVICGVVVIPKSWEDMTLRYKFAMYYPERNKPMQKHLLCVNTKDGRIHVHAFKTPGSKENVDSKQKFIKAIFENTPDIDECIETFLLSELDPARPIEETENEDGPLDLLTNRIVFTFPLRSIGPLQWSESERIRHDKREENYAEAERRCEIIKSFLMDENQTRFDRTKEGQIFKALTKSEAYSFGLSDDSSNSDRQLLLNGSTFALLKAPEGILEAKAFSILMSGKQYKTIILEEPDRGMHPQFIERMVHLIKQYESEKRVILTTHNTAFISPWTLSDCFVFRQNYNECCIVSGKAIAMDTKKPKKQRIFMKKLRLLTSDHLSDILFAKKVLFCEGDSDFLFITELKQQILSGDAKTICIFKGDTFDYMKLEDSLVELTIVKLNGKGNTKLCQSVSKEIKLDAFFLLDKETGGKGEKFGDDTNVFIWKYGDIEDMVIKMCMSNVKLKSDLSEQNVTVNLDKFQKKKESNEKLFLREDVSIASIRTGVKLILEQCKPESDLVSFIRFLYLGKA
ncbi:retron Vc95 probable ATPase-like [Mercenaria mercenaria]|uniref:retron Vc95 probable ATPase-like n=1 Tax=Mercenaria mercenaria TaxID=6596 RepID=UPI00234ECE93|nr:retron Vc95 probable ATPase-like [Mercenaria mercenaria]